VFEGTWPVLLHRGVSLSPGVLRDPRNLPPWESTESERPVRQAGLMLVLRAYQTQGRGADEEALVLLLDALGLSRQLRYGVVWRSLNGVLLMERTAIRGLTYWATGTKNPALLRRALAEVERHE